MEYAQQVKQGISPNTVQIQKVRKVLLQLKKSFELHHDFLLLAGTQLNQLLAYLTHGHNLVWYRPAKEREDGPEKHLPWLRKSSINYRKSGNFCAKTYLSKNFVLKYICVKIFVLKYIRVQNFCVQNFSYFTMI